MLICHHQCASSDYANYKILVEPPPLGYISSSFLFLLNVKPLEGTEIISIPKWHCVKSARLFETPVKKENLVPGVQANIQWELEKMTAAWQYKQHRHGSCPPRWWLKHPPENGWVFWACALTNGTGTLISILTLSPSQGTEKQVSLSKELKKVKSGNWMPSLTFCENSPLM